MTELIDDFKEKPKRRSAPLPVDFVIPLQLEECVHQLENHRIPPALTGLKLQFLTGGENGQDRFNAAFFEENAAIIEAEGLVKRWEGTSTRFQGKAYFPGFDVLGLGCMLNLVMTILACGISENVIRKAVFEIKATSYSDGISQLTIVLGVMAIYFLVSTVLLFQLNRYRKRRRLIGAIKRFFES